MAAGEYVSVSSQADSEQSDLDRERRELESDPDFEQAELARIYQSRGVSPDLARQVATQLMAGDALGAHAREDSESRISPRRARCKRLWRRRQRLRSALSHRW
jgi:VIT1/CCC1 family predicted Fe2+/Mn2+ transporter